MDDTRGRIAVPDVSEATALEISPAMIEAGERAIFSSDVWPNLCVGGWSSDLAVAVYRAMEDARFPKRRQ